WGAPSASVKLEDGFDDGVGQSLAKAGHQVEWIARGDSFGQAGALVRGHHGAIQAAHDPRSDGGAAGL
ncbi:MAG: gamma-glutamyltransferase, partial [Roseiarcus sp.]